MADRLHLQPQHREVLEALLREHLPGVEVWAYGSRVSGRSHDGSDLDLVLRGPGLDEIPIGQLGDFEEAVRESSIPFLVEARDWARLPERFHQEIERDHVVFVERKPEHDWCDVSLGDVTDFLSGGTPSKDQTAYWNGSIPWVSAKDMKRFHLRDTEDHITAEGLANGTKQVPAGSVLLLTRGMTLLNELPVCVTEQPMAFNQDVKALRPKPGIDHSFLPYLVLGHKQRLLNLVDLAGHGTGRLNSDELRNLDIQLPPLNEQKVIAHILGTLDDKIELNRRMNETLEAMARALFKSWFVDFDPVHAKMDGRDPYLEREVWGLFPDTLDDEDKPVGWSSKPLDEIAEFLNGLALQKFPASDLQGSLPVIKIAELRSGITSKSGRASRKVPENYIVRDSDFLFSWSGSLLAKFWTGGEGALNQHLFKVTSSRYPSWFFSQWVHYHLERFQAIAASKATTMGHIQRGHLKEAITICPPDDVLAILGETIGPLVDRKIGYQLESRSLSALRDVLLPKLISGDIRLSDAEKVVEAVA